VLLPTLLIKELTDEPMPLSDAEGNLDEVPALAEMEDRVVQNQLTHIVPLKPGWFRLFLLKKVLGTIDKLAHGYFNRGDLGGIPTIHFARWGLLEDSHLYFFSNYDGSWENYLGDFIDIAAVGLTSVWSNSVGFPRTTLLAFKGARDEERFKAWTRKRQVATQYWFSAYPTLSVRNTLNNEAIAEGLAKDLTGEREITDFLRLL
jgi:hypothetical protein